MLEGRTIDVAYLFHTQQDKGNPTKPSGNLD
jgi:hypothetical protein